MDFVFKVDVETRKGLEQAVPNLLDAFKGLGIKASFFIPFGPDRTGVAIRRLWEQHGIMKKACAINPFRFYGLPTLLYGTVLPAPDNVIGLEYILKRIIDDGHELGVHGYDHVEWHDRLFVKDNQFMIDQITEATEAYRKAIRTSPEGFAAPGWQIKQDCYHQLKKIGYLYSASTRGISPFIPECGGENVEILEMPTTLPTLDELYVIFGNNRPKEILGSLLSHIQEDRLNIHTIHAELEGTFALPLLKELIYILKDRGASFFILKDLAKKAMERRGSLESSPIGQRHVDGRPGLVTCQR